MEDKELHNEKELLLQVAAGNAHSFRKLVDRCWNKVYANTLALTKSTEIAEELTQDIFLKIWDRRANLLEVENFNTYLYVVGRHQVIDHLRKKIKDIAAGWPNDSIENALLPDRQLEAKEVNQLLLQAIEKLPPMRRKVFKMNRFEALSYEEIAIRLGLSRNTVKDHIVMALNFLRNYLRQKTGRVWISFLLFLIK